MDIYLTPFHLANLVGHLWIWQKLLGELFCNDKWNNVISYGSANLVGFFYPIISPKNTGSEKYWYWILIFQYFLDTDTDTASVFFRLSTDTDTSVF